MKVQRYQKNQTSFKRSIVVDRTHPIHKVLRNVYDRTLLVNIPNGTLIVDNSISLGDRILRAKDYLASHGLGLHPKECMTLQKRILEMAKEAAKFAERIEY